MQLAVHLGSSGKAVAQLLEGASAMLKQPVQPAEDVDDLREMVRLAYVRADALRQSRDWEECGAVLGSLRRLLAGGPAPGLEQARCAVHLAAVQLACCTAGRLQASKLDADSQQLDIDELVQGQRDDPSAGGPPPAVSIADVVSLCQEARSLLAASARAASNESQCLAALGLEQVAEPAALNSLLWLVETECACCSGGDLFEALQAALRAAELAAPPHSPPWLPLAQRAIGVFQMDGLSEHGRRAAAVARECLLAYFHQSPSDAGNALDAPARRALLRLLEAESEPEAQLPLLQALAVQGTLPAGGRGRWSGGGDWSTTPQEELEWLLCLVWRNAAISRLAEDSEQCLAWVDVGLCWLDASGSKAPFIAKCRSVLEMLRAEVGGPPPRAVPQGFAAPSPVLATPVLLPPLEVASPVPANLRSGSGSCQATPRTPPGPQAPGSWRAGFGACTSGLGGGRHIGNETPDFGSIFGGTVTSLSSAQWTL